MPSHGRMIPAFLNPAARNAAAAEAALRRAECFDVRAVSPDEVTQAVSSAIQSGAQRVTVVGGDGTISAAAAAAVHHGAELAVIPGGTFNHFATAHAIPTHVEQACRVASTGIAIDADIAWVNGRVFVSTSSVGAYASYVRARERLEPRFGFWAASLFAGVRSLARLRAFDVQFESKILNRPYVTPLVFIGLGERELKLPKLGNRVANGRTGLHVMIVRGRTRARLLALAFDAAARGTKAVSRTPHLDSFFVDSCVIEQRHSTVALDGEVVTMTSPLEYRVGRGALRLVTPRP